MSTYREQLADALIPVAMELAFTVRTGTADDVAAVLDKVHPAHFHALAVVLAAAVDIDSTPEELFGWSVETRGDSGENPVPACRETSRETFPPADRRDAVSDISPAQAEANRAVLARAISTRTCRAGDADYERSKQREAA